MIPTDRQYTKTHEWLKVEGDTAIMGITDHAQKELGDITFVERPAVGRQVVQGKECGVIESVKAASDLYAPVGGTVAATNGELEAGPGLVNEDAYGRGWILKLKPFEAGQVGGLLDAAAYEAFLKSSGH